MAARVAYFKHIDQASVDADQATALLSLAGRMTAVESGKADASAVAAKADVAYVDSSVGAVAADVAGKLDITTASATYATASSVMLKADIAFVEGQVNALAASKANASDLLQVQQDVSSHTSQLIGLGQQVSNKQDASQASQRVAAENAFISALKEAIYIESAPGSGAEYDYTPLGL